MRVIQRLTVGVHHNKRDAVDVLFIHVVDGIVATATNTYHLYHVRNALGLLLLVESRIFFYSIENVLLLGFVHLSCAGHVAAIVVNILHISC